MVEIACNGAYIVEELQTTRGENFRFCLGSGRHSQGSNGSRDRPSRVGRAMAVRMWQVKGVEREAVAVHRCRWQLLFSIALAHDAKYTELQYVSQGESNLLGFGPVVPTLHHQHYFGPCYHRKNIKELDFRSLSFLASFL